MEKISKEKLESLKRNNEKIDHEWRKKQIEKFAPFAKKVLKTALDFNDGEFTNETLTAFIQMFKANCTFPTFEKYYNSQFKDYNLAEEFGIKDLFKDNIKGNTNAARATVKDLDIETLNNVKKILKEIADYNENEFEKIKEKCDEFFEKEWKFLTFGIISPWLYYIHPRFCPIINSKVKKQLKNLGWDGKKYSEAMEKCKELANELNFSDLGYIDSLLYYLNENNEQQIDTNQNPNNKNIIFSKNLILYGPPGTGKTYSTKRKAVQVIEGKSDEEISAIEGKEIDEKFDNYKIENRIEFVTFHQSFSYEQFVEGISVETTEDNNIRYYKNDGVFKSNCTTSVHINSDSDDTEPKEKYLKEFILSNTKAERKLFFDKSSKPFVLIIDEINRGNISKIFGELITLIEDDKRLGEENEITVTLPYSGDTFGVPPNLYIIGTMNTADRSLVQLDTALRRRFEFEEMMPKYHMTDKMKSLKDYGIIQNLGWDNNGKVDELDISIFLYLLNEKITENYDREHQIGHSFLMKVKDKEDLKRAWENKIMPLLQEYFYANYDDLAKVIGKSEYLSKVDNKWKLNMKATNFNDAFGKVYEHLVLKTMTEKSNNDNSEG